MSTDSESEGGLPRGKTINGRNGEATLPCNGIEDQSPTPEELPHLAAAIVALEDDTTRVQATTSKSQPDQDELVQVLKP